MMKLILLYNLFYFRREKAFCNECRYCCTLPFCSYKENDSEDNLHLYKKQLYIIYWIRSDFFSYFLHKKIHSQPFFRNNCCRRRTFWWYRRNGAPGIKSFFFLIWKTHAHIWIRFDCFSKLDTLFTVNHWLHPSYSVVLWLAIWLLLLHLVDVAANNKAM